LIKKIIYPVLLVALAYLLLSSEESKVIIAGIAIFLIGMIFMEDGFKFFSGGFLERILENSTNTTIKSIFTGFLSTSIVQSSSLISIIVISFLTAGLMSLSGAIGVIFGSNIGTTTTAWIISSFGMKINIATYAMPMIIFGVIFKLLNEKNIQGIGNILIGLGFIFLGIEYMKDGFETLKSGFDLSKYAISGYLGVLVYILLGIVATVIIQSSSATMALIITALASGQIIYMNALELAIGANIGTTITALIASLASNSNGKRLAIAHLIFNMITGVVAIVFLYPLASLVDVIAIKIGISDNEYAMKLALFHTVFNLLGVLIVSPFIKKLVVYLGTLFTSEKSSSLKPIYLDDVVIKIPDAALNAIKKEIIHLFDNAVEVISHALYLHRHNFLGSDNIEAVVKNSNLSIKTDVNEFYSNKIKILYGEIIHFSSLSQENMSDEEKKRVYELKLASRDIVEAIKDIRELQKNISIYLKSNNQDIKDEYNNLRINIAKTIKIINELKDCENCEDLELKINQLNENLKENDDINSDKIDSLIRKNQITSKMATSLINDSNYAQNIIKRLIEAANIIWK